jgi:RNA recognition motif-containing protein
MPNDSEAEKAIAAINGSSLGGRTLNVNEARPRTGGAPGDFGGGGGPRGGGREQRGGGRREPRW